MNFEDILKMSTSELEKFLTTKTVVGDPIIVGDVTLVPIQNVSFGYGTGGGEGGSDKDKGAGGGGGAGAHLRPVAIVAVKNGTDVQLYSLGKKGAAEAVVELIPEVLSKIKIGKGKNNGKDAEDAEKADEGEKEE